MYTKTIEKAEKVLDLYNIGKTVTEIIEVEGPMSKKTVKKILASYGIDYTSELKKKNDTKPAEVLKLYQEGRSLLEIEAELKLTYTTVRDILKEAGIEQRSLSQQAVIRYGNSIDETCFDILTPDTCYWMGLIYADGHVFKEGEYRVEICLHANDKELLEKYKDFLKSNKEIRVKSDNNAVEFTFGCERIHKRLKGLGFHHNKSYTGVPHELLKHSRDFWRGVIDGDGCLWSAKNWSSQYGYRRSIQLCGTEATCQGFKDFVEESGIISKASVRKVPNEQTWVIAFEANIADCIAKLLYEGSITYMERKYQKYINYFKN